MNPRIHNPSSGLLNAAEPKRGAQLCHGGVRASAEYKLWGILRSMRMAGCGWRQVELRKREVLVETLIAKRAANARKQKALRLKRRRQRLRAETVEPPAFMLAVDRGCNLAQPGFS